MSYVIYYDGKKLLSLPEIDGSPEEWADLYASESGLDRELDYDPSLLEVVKE